MNDRGKATGRENAPSTHQLRLFLTLAEELHFRRAAQRTFMSQAAFSQQISALERRLGLTLVKRTTRRVTLTPAGADLIPYARAVVAANDEFQRAAQRHLDAASGRIVIGSFEAITALAPIPAVMNELRQRMPGLEIRIVRLGFAGSFRAVLDEEVDAAFVFLPVPDGIQALPLATGTRCAVMASTDPLAERGPLTLADLSNRPYIGFSPTVPKVYRDYWSVDPRPDGVPIRYTSHAVTDYESALSLIALGEGIEFVPDLARHLYPRPGVSYVDVTDLAPWTTALAWLPRNRDKPIISALRAAARDTLS